MNIDKKGITKETCYYYINPEYISQRERKKLEIECSDCNGEQKDCLKYIPLGERGFYEYLERINKN
ncbi:MAG: hypothetical protein ACOC3Z_01805 [Nanoarchaeota archaeon]